MWDLPRPGLEPMSPALAGRFFFFFFFLIFIYLFIYLWLCWVFVSVRGFPLVEASGGHSSSRCMGLSLSRPLLLQSTGSRRAGSVVVAHGPSCSAACGLFPDQGSNLYPLHLQADSFFFFFFYFFYFFFFFFFNFIYLFIYFWLCWIFGSCEGSL